MLVIPCIDIYNGLCVQLVNGKTNTAVVYGSPQEFLEKWENQGAKVINIIDLDATLNLGSNKKIIFDLIKKSNVELQVGGGVRDKKYACDLISRGASRVIIGSKCLDVDFLKNLNQIINKNQIVAALDIKDGCILKNGWKTDTGISFDDGFDKIKKYVGVILSTNVEIEGMLNGIDSGFLRKIKQKNIPFLVSGGFTSKKDVEIARELGFSGVVIGKAFYENKISLEEFDF